MNFLRKHTSKLSLGANTDSPTSNSNQNTSSPPPTTTTTTALAPTSSSSLIKNTAPTSPKNFGSQKTIIQVGNPNPNANTSNLNPSRLNLSLPTQNNTGSVPNNSSASLNTNNQNTFVLPSLNQPQSTKQHSNSLSLIKQNSKDNSLRGKLNDAKAILDNENNQNNQLRLNFEPPLPIGGSSNKN